MRHLGPKFDPDKILVAVLPPLTQPRRAPRASGVIRHMLKKLAVLNLFEGNLMQRATTDADTTKPSLEKAEEYYINELGMRIRGTCLY